MHISLLAKWRWRLISEKEPFWKGIIQAKYGRGRDLGEWVFREAPRASDSLWWKDLLKIGLVACFDWLHQIFFKKIGNGSTTLFWRDPWVGTTSLKDLFPHLRGRVDLEVGFQMEVDSLCVRRGISRKFGNFVDSNPTIINGR
ncbi:ribonuclease H protein [Trifolium medium]|uniref:Ribonuclease H protein n=1 Tax=Trifolium medium TaxID=97028 RepID=A0A392PWB9_9FABA|nr:ribonuclease H protein [Trifolium medium]